MKQYDIPAAGNEIESTNGRYERFEDCEPDFKTDENALYIFSKLMAHKLAKKSAEGRSGWQECSQEELTRMLRQHVEKGDPVDVANFCMMLSANGMRIGPPTDAGEVERLRAQLAERDALLRRALNGGDDSLGLDIADALSAITNND